MFYLALKNIFYYKGRSIATFLLTLISTMLFIVYVSFMDGTHTAMLEDSLKVYGGAIEIYKKEYRDIGGNEYLIEDVKTITDKLENVPEVESFSSRYETYALLSSKNYSSASMVVGIEPSKEKEISSIALALKDGEFLSDKSTNCIYMGVGLVQKLHVSLGDEVSYIGSASDNSFAADLFKVCGTFKTGAFEFDATTSFISRSYFDELMYAQNKASYITLKLHDINNVDNTNIKITKLLDDNSLESLTWKTLMKTMVEAMEVDSIFGYITLALFVIVIFFVIMIYGFVNISSRTKELGVLRCIGVNRSRLFSLLFWEIFILTTLAMLIATPLGAYICYYFSIYPIVIDGIAEMYKDYGIISDELPMAFDMLTIGWNISLIYLLNIISIIYPFYYIDSFKPIKATKHV